MASDSPQDTFDGHEVLEVFYGALMDIVLVSTAFSMIIMSATDYHIRRYLAEGQQDAAKEHLSSYYKYRFAARGAIYMALISFLIAMTLHVQTRSNHPRQIVDTIILGVGTVCIALVTHMML